MLLMQYCIEIINANLRISTASAPPQHEVTLKIDMVVAAYENNVQR